MAKCRICGQKDPDVIMGECPRCREILADQKTEEEIREIWATAAKQLENLEDEYVYFS